MIESIARPHFNAPCPTVPETAPLLCSSTIIILVFCMGLMVFLLSGRLLQQFCLDTRFLAEQNNLRFIPQNQAQIYANWCQDLLNHLQRRQKDQNDGNGNNAPGVPVILPSSYQVSPCNKNKQYNDVMAIVSVIGRPDFYHHYYTNLHWPEMTKHLLFNINLLNYPVLTSKVFKMFLKHVIDNLWQ